VLPRDRPQWPERDGHDRVLHESDPRRRAARQDPYPEGMTSSSGATPDFSPLAAAYLRGRPRYPAELFAWLAAGLERHELAWDAATGNGQAALGLARHFRRVVATDRSAEQIARAVPDPAIEYRVGSAEASGLADGSVDLVTVAAAIHWFDLEAFSAEVRRIARPGAVVAAWTYHAVRVGPPFEAVLEPFYRDVVGPWFAPGARLVDERYEAIRLPGTALDTPAFEVTVRWSASELLEYVRSWSGVLAYREVTGRDPLAELWPALEHAGGGPERRHDLRWPLYLRAARLDA